MTSEDVLAGDVPPPLHEKRAFLDVRDLRVHFPTDDGVVKSVDGLSFHLERGKTLGIVGESGSGKSVTSLSIMGLHKAGAAKISGEIWLDGTELVSADPETVRKLRGKKMAMIFQDPLSAMHPFYTVGAQIVEAYRVHNDVCKKAARKRAIEMLDRVGIPQPQKRVDDYPHQFSGGMRQRAMIAMALSCNPDLLIADEPTTALDVTVQAQILDLIRGPAEGVRLRGHHHHPRPRAWSPSWPTTSWSCTRGGRSSTARRATSSRSPSTRTRGGCSAPCRGSTASAPTGSCRSPAARRA